MVTHTINNPSDSSSGGRLDPSLPVVAEPELLTALQEQVGQTLPPLLSGLACLYGALALGSAFLPPALELAPGIVLPALTATLFVGLRLMLGRGALPGRWTHPVAFVALGLVFLNSLAHFHRFADPLQTLVLILLVLGAGCVFLSSEWLTWLLVVALGGWTCVAGLTNTSWASFYTSSWIKVGGALLAAAALAVALQRFRVRSLRQLQLHTLQESALRQKCVETMRMVQEKEERFRRLSEATFEGLAVVDKGQIIDANPFLTTVIG